MKTLYCVIISILCASYAHGWEIKSTVGAVASSVDLTDGLIHYWPLDEGSGNDIYDGEGSRDGTNSGAAWVTNGLDFEYTESDYVTFGTTALSVSTGWSFAFKFKLESTANNRIWTKHLAAADGIIVLASDKISVAYATESDGSDWAGFDGTASSITTGVTYTVVLTWDGSDIKLYLDGTEDTGGTFPVSEDTMFWQNSQTLYIGKDGSTGTKRMDGEVYFFYVWDKALSQSEITELQSDNYFK